MIKSFCAWLAGTPLSLAIQNHGWVIPTVQSIHILAIAAMATAIVAVDLRLLGAGSAPLAALDRRFRAWIWSGLATLLTSGLILTIGEPARELLNPVFVAKMIMVLGLAAIAFVVQAGLDRDGGYWETRVGGKALALVSLVLLLAIITCGRWIAYVVVEG